MGRDDPELAAAAADYVCVKVTDMRDVDVQNLRFDFDLTFAVLLMHSDGTVYHRYGSRGPDSADGYLSMTSLARLLRDTLPEHERYAANPAPPPAAPPRRAIEMPFLQRRLAAGQQIDCVHCHTVNTAQHDELERGGSFDPEAIWVYPDPERAGFTLDPERQRLVRAVRDDSPAAAAGLRIGDELVVLADVPVRTLADVQWALHGLPSAATKVAVRFRRGNGEDAERATELSLPAGWKHCSPADYAWRSYKWNLSPAPGFGGPLLSTGEKEKLGLPADRFALKVQYLVEWGEQAHRGRAAKAAGLRRGDIVVGYGDRDDFGSFPELFAWTALTRTPGQRTDIVVLRQGKRVTLEFELPR
ncbi:MAG: PDZ domain-containing protein [Planctomycetes bacterium]|nr:PDZ domain-containing protein [Planctomycetota bacterium]